ncbi:MAG: exodeoxyribonuclease VII large subunit [Alistipes sp.]|jgi:exodeoxyribonuclease VII large subunit|nr:exodeoxyribonuclease VII large subunit [Alistipes sp.]
MTEKKHLSLGELLSGVGRALNDAFPMPLWVAAEIADLRVAGTGHCYLELVEKGTGSVPRAQARAVVWRGTWASLGAYFLGVTGSALSAGMKVLVKVSVSHHELYGFSLVVSDIDPSYTLGDRERQRLETIARLRADGVWDMNRQLDLPLPVQRVAVVSSASAAGFRDFTQELSRYPWRVSTELFEAVMQGEATEQTVIAALERIAERADEFDAVAIVRGGGSTSDLSAFDGYLLCAHIAQFPLPIATGIGHDKDRSVADMVAALELKTPTAVAVWLGEGLESFSRLLDELAGRLADSSAAVLERSATLLERFGRVVSLGAVEMTRRLEMRLERLSGDVSRLSGERLLRERHRLTSFEALFAERPAMLLARSAERLAGYEQIVAARRPENILALGFAIVRSEGKAVLDPEALANGQPLEITLAKGNLKAKTVK